MSRATILHVSLLHPHPGNARADLGDLSELADSIRAAGIIEPLVVQRHPSKGGHYEVLAGHRRLAAAKLARLNDIPVVIRQGIPSEGGALKVMLIENCHREDLTAIDKAVAMGKLRDRHRMSAAQIAKATGLSASTISYHLSLLDLDESTRRRVAAGTVKAGDARAAVRATRAATRRQNGHAPRKATVAAEHFSAAHPLAEAAKVHCELSGHTARKVGKTACGGCWEAVNPAGRALKLTRCRQRPHDRASGREGGAFRCPRLLTSRPRAACGTP